MIRQFECGRTVTYNGERYVIVSSYVTDRVMYRIQSTGDTGLTHDVAENVLITNGNKPIVRVPVQVSVGLTYHPEMGETVAQYVALCSDGTMWQMYEGRDQWDPLPEIPQ